LLEKRSMTRFLLVRHASHDLLGRVLAGRMPGVHLNARGRREAAWLRDRLAGPGGRPDVLVTSPLERSLETAGPIASALRLTPQVEPALGEMAFGEWTGRSFEELERVPAWRSFNVCRSAARVPGGETMLEAQARAVSALERLRECYGDATLAIVSHGDVLRAAVAHYLGLSIDLLHRFEIEPASITTLHVSAQDARLIRLNECPELREAPEDATPSGQEHPAGNGTRGAAAAGSVGIAR
jgi:broad specificity phosphatase PhoE